jgi:hypothetical protein
MSESSSSSTFEGTLERFPDLRLATAIVESPRTVLATLFGVPTNDLPVDVTEVATQRLHELACSDPKRWIA